MSWGDIANIMNGNNVLFKMGRTSGSPDPVEELVLLESFKMVKDLPVNRTSSRSGPVEVPDFVLREFLLNVNVTKDLFDKLEAISEPTTRGGFNIEDFELDAESVAGASQDSVLNCDGYVRHFEANGVKGTKYNIDVTIRVINNTVVIS